MGSQQDPISTNRNNIHLHCRGLTHKLGMEIYIAALWYCIAFWVIYKCLWKENFHKNYASDDILELEVPQLSHYIQKDCCVWDIKPRIRILCSSIDNNIKKRRKKTRKKKANNVAHKYVPTQQGWCNKHVIIAEGWRFDLAAQGTAHVLVVKLAWCNGLLRTSELHRSQ